MRKSWLGIWLVAVLVGAVAVPAALAGRVIDGLAVVQADGSLSVGGERVFLWGVYLPRLERTCSTYVRPPRCGAPSILILDDLVDGFVRCEVVREGRDAVQGGLLPVQHQAQLGRGRIQGAVHVHDAVDALELRRPSKETQ